MNNQNPIRSATVWAVEISFYASGICGGTVTANVLANSGAEAIGIARRHRESHHGCAFDSFDVLSLKQVCSVEIGNER